ncbi:unnamed protein product [Closterium sp. NIES-65]|nr:unnamed protein product [Closterium sp. NIES-65]
MPPSAHPPSPPSAPHPPHSCSAAVVSVELNNEGEEAFRPDEFGPRLTVERRITDNGSSTLALKDFRGRKVRSKREDLDELTAHFNLDVDNPCIVMSQDKSREFLHSGTPKDKYKFFIKATLLEKVSARLGSISGRLVVCRRQIGEAETALGPLEEKARQAEQQVRELEEAESRGQEADRVTKQLAWAYVHEAEQEVEDAERAKREAQERVAELEERLATAQSRVETVQQQMEQHMGRVKGCSNEVERVKAEQDRFRQQLAQASRQRGTVEAACVRLERSVEDKKQRAQELSARIQELQDRASRNSQADRSLRDAEVAAKQSQVEEAKERLDSVNRELQTAQGGMRETEAEQEALMKQEDEARARARDVQAWLRRRRDEARDKLTAFGGQKVTQLLRQIEMNIGRFRRPPIGPIGAHLSLERIIGVSALQSGSGAGGGAEIGLLHSLMSQGLSRSRSTISRLCPLGPPHFHTPLAFSSPSPPSLPFLFSPHSPPIPPFTPSSPRQSLESAHYSMAVEVAVGRMLDSFIVSCLEDYHVLKRLAASIGLQSLNVVTYGFDLPPIEPPTHVLPPEGLVTVLSVLNIANPVVRNVLIDQGGVETTVLVRDFDEGKDVAFSRALASRIRECITQDGMRLFMRGNQEVSLPCKRNMRGGRLGCNLEEDEAKGREEEERLLSSAEQFRRQREAGERELRRKRNQVQQLQIAQGDAERVVRMAQIELREVRHQMLAAQQFESQVNVSDLEEELERVEAEAETERASLEEQKGRLEEAKEEERVVLGNKGRLEEELRALDEALGGAMERMDHLTTQQRRMQAAVKRLTDDLQRLQHSVAASDAEIEHKRSTAQAKRQQAGMVCEEEEGQQEGEEVMDSEDLRKRLMRLRAELPRDYQAVLAPERKEELQHRAQKLRGRYTATSNTIQLISLRHEQLEKSLGVRVNALRIDSNLLGQNLDWTFQDHLSRKRYTGHVLVDHTQGTLTLEINTSTGAVTDVKALSGGERSFSTLCFALSLHQLTEAPVRAMDEFDIFMDNITRKICLRHAVDFAISNGSQWIFITPHDITEVDDGPQVKKQRMHPPRPSE